VLQKALADLDADFQESDHRFHLKSINDLSLGDHHRSEATLACMILRGSDRFHRTTEEHGVHAALLRFIFPPPSKPIGWIKNIPWKKATPPSVYAPFESATPLVKQSARSSISLPITAVKPVVAAERRALGTAQPAAKEHRQDRTVAEAFGGTGVRRI
jgi:hypothetical protein